jgi:hypothetical protein
LERWLPSQRWSSLTLAGAGIRLFLTEGLNPRRLAALAIAPGWGRFNKRSSTKERPLTWEAGGP